MKSFEYVIKEEVGIHARPAGLLVKEARKYASKIILHKDGQEADATKLLTVMGMGVKCGEKVKIEISGEDEEKTYVDMLRFFESNL
ncbi:HPr family phosphocarrier protein [Anaerocolumna xylanovorans]|uniref:Phosphocarrier protein n=1 Tax=Anaerocolumna xylanovorans DSM 12503 TaxID=1121345 RepID=A0A1M7Y0R0_9FIRM|nr:HPr family phosphocarrier protein [Anaerocolumna xylanovorans]SHO45277.1 phosphocarrier protein [Anaerocolumna xylanovorans DSM 12503]